MIIKFYNKNKLVFTQIKIGNIAITKYAFDSQFPKRKNWLLDTKKNTYILPTFKKLI